MTKFQVGDKVVHRLFNNGLDIRHHSMFVININSMYDTSIKCRLQSMETKWFLPEELIKVI